MIAFGVTGSVGFRCIMLVCGWRGCLDSRFPVAGAVGQVSWCCGCCAFRFAGFAGCFRDAGCIFAVLGLCRVLDPVVFDLGWFLVW